MMQSYVSQIYAFNIDASTEFPNQTVESTVQPSAFSNYTEPLTGAGAAAAATVTARAGVAYNKASEVYSNPSAFIPGIVSAQGGTSMPSQEFEGQQPFEHSNGVGALPGRLQEESVAKLPEERREQSLHSILGPCEADPSFL
jgi:hypothetical protein